jgi:hypothetical protein
MEHSGEIDLNTQPIVQILLPSNGREVESKLLDTVNRIAVNPVLSIESPDENTKPE